MSKFINLIGQRFGRLTVIQWAGKDKWGHSKWLCRCDCNNKNEIIVSGNHLKSGHTKSCGCLHKEKAKINAIKHGHCKNRKATGFYESWHSMIQRCTNPNNKDYKDYGGRGITVCEEWMEFPNFERDNLGWEPGLTIERDNNELGYFPGNCYWGNRTEQNRNKRSNLYVPYRGENRLLIELCEEYNMPYHVVWDRIYRYGWSPEKALTTPVRKKEKRKEGKIL